MPQVLPTPGLDVSLWPLEACHIPPPGSVDNELLYFNSLVVFCDPMAQTPSNTLGLFLTNVHLTVTALHITAYQQLLHISVHMVSPCNFSKHKK